MTVQEAEAHVTDARDALNAMHRVQAVSEAEADANARAKALALPNALARVDEFARRHAAIVAEQAAIPLGTVTSKSGELTQQNTGATGKQLDSQQHCPHCGITGVSGS